MYVYIYHFPSCFFGVRHESLWNMLKPMTNLRPQPADQAGNTVPLPGSQPAPEQVDTAEPSEFRSSYAGFTCVNPNWFVLPYHPVGTPKKRIVYKKWPVDSDLKNGIAFLSLHIYPSNVQCGPWLGTHLPQMDNPSWIFLWQMKRWSFLKYSTYPDPEFPGANQVQVNNLFLFENMVPKRWFTFWILSGYLT